MGVSLGYNGGDSGGILNWPTDTFCIANHQDNASGAVALSIKRFSGDVGIGTDNPGAKLHIYDGASETEIFLGESAAIDKSGIIKYEQGDGSGTGKMLIGNWGDSLSTQSLCVKKGGNVGIGITNPSSLLHLKQTNSASDCIIKIEADRGVNSNIPLTGIEFKSNDGDTGDSNTYLSKILSGWIQGEDDYDDSFFKIQTYHTNSSTDLQDTLVIKGSNVGIGTTNPGSKLRAKEI